MENPDSPAKSTRRYQTRRNQEIKQREERRQERDEVKRTAKQEAALAGGFNYYEDVVPVPEPDRVVRYWRVGKLRTAWAQVWQRTGWQFEQLEEFIAARRRPAIIPPDQPCPPVRYPGWYLDFSGSTE